MACRPSKLQMHERDAFRAIFSFGGTLEALDPHPSRNVPCRPWATPAHLLPK